MNIRYRPRRKTDDAFLIRSTLLTMKQVFEQSVGAQLDEQAVLAIIDSCDNTRIIELGGRPIGYVSYSELGPGWMYLGAVILMPVVQSQGLGTRVVQDLICDAKGRGVNVIDCHVQTENHRALRFWQKHGWQITGPPVGGSYELRKWLSFS